VMQIHERVYWTYESGHLQCSRPMVNCSVQHVCDPKRSFTITQDEIRKASAELDKKVSTDVKASVDVKLKGLGGVKIGGDFSDLTSTKQKIEEELKRHIGEKMDFELKEHAPPCYEVVWPYGAYVVLALDGGAKITRYYTWNPSKGEIEWTDHIEMEPNPPLGYHAQVTIGFGMFPFADDFIHKVMCDCHGDQSANPPTAEELGLDEPHQGGDKPAQPHDKHKKKESDEEPAAGHGGGHKRPRRAPTRLELLRNVTATLEDVTELLAAETVEVARGPETEQAAANQRSWKFKNPGGGNDPVDDLHVEFDRTGVRYTKTGRGDFDRAANDPEDQKKIDLSLDPPTKVHGEAKCNFECDDGDFTIVRWWWTLGGEPHGPRYKGSPDGDGVGTPE
jgi:hypothetical protein